MIKPLPRRSALPFAVLAAALTASCGNDVTLPEEGEAAELVIVDGNTQVGPVGTALAGPLVVRVLDTQERGVANQDVTFVVVGEGGSVEPEVVRTGTDGIASAAWTLGAIAGAHSLRVRTPRGGGGEPLEVEFTATAVAGSGSVLVGVGGDDQTGPVNSALADSLVVKATDALGNPVANVEVTWSAAGGGTISPVTATTGVDGLAAAERVLGASAGEQSARATVEGFTGSPVVFSHTAEPANPTALVLISGDGQRAPAGFEVAQDLVVRLEDPNGNGIGGRPITWVVPVGSGSVSPISVTTNANGLATTRWTMPAFVGEHTVNAVFSGLPPVVFSATATADVPTTIEMVSGNGQSAPVGAAVTNPLVVRVTDANDNPVAGVSVAWTAQDGGSVSADNTATDQQGLARVTRTLGSTPGQYNTTAAVEGLDGSPITFVSTATVGAPAQLAILTAPGSPTVSGSTFSPAPVIQVQDAQGNPVPQGGIPIVVTITSGQPGATLENDSRNTNVNGRVTFTTLRISGPPDDDYVLTFTAQFAGAPLTPVSTGPLVVTAGGATRLILTQQPSASAQSGVEFAQQPVIQVVDGTGNPVSGNRTIEVEIGEGTGTLEGDVTISTNGGSTATFTDLAISGTVGSRTLIFSSGALTPVESNSINVTTGPAASIAIQSGDDQTAAAGSELSTDPAVIIRDSGGNPVAGVQVTFEVTGGGGSATPTTVTTGSNGIAATNWTLGATAGDNELTATSSVGSVTFDATGTAGSASNMQIHEGDDQTADAGSTLSTDPAVMVRDAGGNPVAGVQVTFEVTGGGGSATPTTVTTGSNGIAATNWTLGTTPGANELTATSSVGSVTFDATGNALETSTTLSVEPTSSAPSGEQVTFTATVSSGDGTPSGTVSFREGTTDIGTGTLSGGVATFQTSSLPVGTYSFTALYSGQGIFAPSTSNTVGYEIAASNAPPEANSDAGFLVDEGGTLNVDAPGVLANDTDPDGDALTAQLAEGPENGTLELDPSGSFTYTPAPDFNGTDEFTYRATDGVAASELASVSITVNAVNDEPGFTPAGGVELTVVNAAVGVSDQWATGIDPGPPDESEQDLAFAVTLNNPADAEAFAVPPQISDDGTLTFTAIELALVAPRVIPLTAKLSDDQGASAEVAFAIILQPPAGP